MKPTFTNKLLRFNLFHHILVMILILLIEIVIEYLKETIHTGTTILLTLVYSIFRNPK